MKELATKNSDDSHIFINCVNCEKITQQLVVASYTQTVFEENEDALIEEGEPPYWANVGIWQLSLCPFCEYMHLSITLDDGEVRLRYPSPLCSTESFPRPIAKAYRAARAVRNIDANAYAVLLGRLLEIICQEQNAQGRHLEEQLRDLAQRGIIPSRLADIAKQLRRLRNIGAHASAGQLSKSEVPILDDLCVAILDYVYTLPHLTARAEARVQRLRKSSV